MVALTANDQRGSVHQFFDLLRLRFQYYRKVAGWMLVDSVWRFRWPLSWFLTASAFAIGLQGAALGLFVGYGRKLESQTSIELWGLTADTAHSYTLLAAAIGIGGLLFVVSSFVRVYAQKGFANLSVRYGLFCTERLFTIVAGALHGAGWKDVPLAQAEFRKLVTGSGVICSRTMYALLGMVPQAIGLVVYSAFLVYLDPLLTLAILLILCLSLLFFYGLSVQMSRVIRLRAEKKLPMVAGYERLLSFIKVAPEPIVPGHSLLDDAVWKGGFADFFRAIFHTKILGMRSAQVGEITQAIVLVVIGITLGGRILITGTGFGDLIAFLIAGRMAMGAFTSLIGTMVRIHRYYPVISNYFNLIDRLERLRDSARTAPSIDGVKSAVVTAPSLADETAAPVLFRGDRIALVTPKSFDRFALLQVLLALRIGDDRGRPARGSVTPAACWLVPEEPGDIPLSFLEATGLPSGTTAAKLRRDLTKLGLLKKAIAGLPKDLAATLDKEAWARVDHGSVAGAHLLGAEASGRPVVAIGATSLDAIGKKATRNVLKTLLADRILIVALRPAEATRAGSLGERHVLLYDGEEIIGYLPVEEVKARLDFIKAMERARKEAVDDMLLDEEEL